MASGAREPAIHEFGSQRLERVLVDALAPVPESVLIDDPDWIQLTTPATREANLNCVLLARLSSNEADRRIAEVVQRYRDLGVPFRWIVGPSSTPDDLSARLVHAGVPVLAAALGMTMRVPAEVPPLPTGLTLRRVGPEDVLLYAEVNTRAWQRGADFRHESEASIRRALARPDQRMRSWLVERDGETIGTFNLCLLPGVGYFQGGAIVPEQRRQGIYRATIHHRLAVLRELGVEHAVIWADESTSAGVCRRAGFEPKCRAIFHQPKG
jgi:GNAT superfamily N-acetyltransferase